jgi:predicted helicase
MLPAAVVAHWQVFQMLVETGYQFQGDECIRIFLIDTLADWNEDNCDSTAAPSEIDIARVACRQEPFSVILGNPPFSGISRNQGRWITALLRGRTSDGQKTASYFRANGEPLAERKHWLQDDYVKFIRYAQWKIETAGAGVVGFVTNHGYLDNITFRGMREQLRAAFPRIAVLDLHGNAKKKERAPNGRPDENVFGIESGIAVGILRKPPVTLKPRVDFSEVWGTRDHKLSTLSHGVKPWRTVVPVAPYHFFTPLLSDSGLSDLAREYEHGVSLTDVMPVNSTVAVTARDGFVVAFERDELLERMAMFRDLTISDDHIRGRFFANSRSTRYAAGDTRGWKLTAARRRMASDPDWQRYVRPCLYRPFDQRWIYWADWMVDWPRTEVNQHLTGIDNLALIARRQMLPTQPCNYFWVSRTIPIDGVIRSDNRGSESAFPLLLITASADVASPTDVPLPTGLANVTAEPGHRVSANFSDRFVNAVAEAIQLTWQVEPNSSRKNTFGPRDLFHYIYAQFHSAEYRRRYADWLRIDFPRVFIPATATLFWQLSRLGVALVTAHAPAETVVGKVPNFEKPELKKIESGYPKFITDRILLHDQLSIDEVSADIWEFNVGGHQVCRKWWRDRRGRVATAHDISDYRQLVDGVHNTIEIISQVDQCIESQGGWPRAFPQG